jgi:hypothetical protein
MDITVFADLKMHPDDANEIARVVREFIVSGESSFEYCECIRPFIKGLLQDDGLAAEAEGVVDVGGFPVTVRRFAKGDS